MLSQQKCQVQDNVLPEMKEVFLNDGIWKRFDENAKFLC